MCVYVCVCRPSLSLADANNRIADLEFKLFTSQGVVQRMTADNTRLEEWQIDAKHRIEALTSENTHLAIRSRCVCVYVCEHLCSVCSVHLSFDIKSIPHTLQKGTSVQRRGEEV
jgi:hypothetical protein